ncbi:hypothetical protein ABW21_db0206483 [Orbilia brochopaga]|nr:hypothetical protein ABW21_db0206483 [Drechslerella brochopaga]
MSAKVPCGEPIAIVGRSLRFPGADTPSELWELLSKPRDLLKDFPKDRANIAAFYHPDREHHGTTDVRKSYFVERDHTLFDAAFFNISPLEAETMDPQQRILLELVYEATESAGLTIDSLRGSRTSVFVGVMSVDFNMVQHRDREMTPRYSATGSAISILSNRISYFFDFKGPSITIDTACSSSLVGVHQAVQSLRNGESELAIVAGTNLILSPEPNIARSKLHMLSPTSSSRMWDAQADGFVRGDGFAVVVLKKLSQAIKDKDNILSVIRETAVNSNGRSAGLTVPNLSAQVALIHEVYKRTGLDYRVEADRCQYFEAHGTGTPVGDPVEAEAIHTAFFKGQEDNVDNGTASGVPLYVGSIKTVTGHLEELNPAIEPFYHRVKVPTVGRAWPKVASDSPRRASVNSFGFGGTNAHAIVESYVPAISNDSVLQSEENLQDGASGIASAGPFLFSANSNTSLSSTIQKIATYLENSNSIDLRSLAWTLWQHRTVLPVKVSFASATKEGLLAALKQHIRKNKDASANVGIRSRRFGAENPPRILGIFTGQGAQWPQMGRELIQTCNIFSQVIDTLQTSLNALPDAPSWSLKAELLADPTSSRISEATVGQPLCTAVQIALIDLLRHAGVSFAGVVGHSSGEIAAAYAAGFISASDAIRVAYYRGYHANTVSESGAMMAVSMSFNDAMKFCQSPRFAGHIVVAASNSTNSVTLSGDKDAILEAQAILQETGLARLLRVDKAYHSNYMQPAIEPYLQSLRTCGIQVCSDKPICAWISSVTGNYVVAGTDLDIGSSYWVDNMMNTVLFSRAVDRAFRNGGSFDAMVEVGPHPTLQTPATRTASEVTGSSIPYVSLLKRGSHGVESFSNALGYLWQHLGKEAKLDIDSYWRAFVGPDQFLQPAILQDLPSYPWDHSRAYWKESRISKNARLRDDPPNDLLGRRLPEDYKHEMRWRNILHLRELPWLRGHSFQGQVIFPAAGYVSMAVEAVKIVARGNQSLSIEIQDMSISRALILDEEPGGTEVGLSLRILEEKQNIVTAEFICSSCACNADAEPAMNATGKISVFLEELSQKQLPPRQFTTRSMLSIDIDRFYGTLSELGLDYTGSFHGLKQIRRAECKSTASGFWSAAEVDSPLFVHPAILDTGLQVVVASVGFGSSVRAPYLPTRIQRMRIEGSIAEMQEPADLEVIIDAYATDISAPGKNVPPSISSDFDLFCGDRLRVQVEGLVVSAITGTGLDSSNDMRLFHETVWGVDISSGMIASERDRQRSFVEATESFHEGFERLAHIYMRDLFAQTPKEKIPTFQWYHQRIFEWMEDTFSSIDSGQHPFIKKEWVNDTREMILPRLAKFSETVDCQAMHVVYEKFPAVLAGETTMLEVLTNDDILSHLYHESIDLSSTYLSLAEMVKQIAHRYPHIKVLEVGAGTGATTSRVLDAIDGAFSSYTYTDISNGFFEKAQERFQKHTRRMEFKNFDLRNSPMDQGFLAHTYDVVIASSVLHATPRLKETLTNVRHLLKPGGYLIMLEPTGSSLRLPYLMCGFPGWWLGAEDGRRLSPGITPMQWDALLKDTGFSGVDEIFYDRGEPSKHMCSIMLSQATDDRVTLLRQPLLSMEQMPEVQQVVILGGQTLEVSRLANEIKGLLGPWENCIVRIDSLEAFDPTQISRGMALLSLTELDQPMFEHFTEKTLENLQKLFDYSKSVLWLTRRSRVDNPYCSMTLGLARVLRNEMTYLNLQTLDVDDLPGKNPGPKLITEALLRLLMKDGIDPEVLWSSEPELALKEGALLIPRICLDKDLNNRWVSDQRMVQAEVSTKSVVVNLRRHAGSHYLQQGRRLTTSQIPTGSIMIETDRASLYPIEITDGLCLYACIGKITGTEQKAIAFTTSNASVINTREDWVRKCEVPTGKEDSYLKFVVDSTLARNIISSMASGSILLLHQPEPLMADQIVRIAADADVKVLCSSTSLPLPRDKNWIYIHPFAPLRQLKNTLPRGIVKFVDFSPEPHGHFRSNIRTLLSSLAKESRTITLFPDEVQSGPEADAKTPGQCLEAAIKHFASRGHEGKAVYKVAANGLEKVEKAKERTCLIDWSGPDEYLASIEPLNPRDLFSSNKTYVLFGLTGETGQSLARWMILNGVRNIVLTSRRGIVPLGWLEDMRDLGANVRIFSMDITQRDDLARVHKEIVRTMPPIAGVVNGAMVLVDSLFQDMTIKAMNEALGPKVEGSKNLDALFGHTDLDFFIMFSSVSNIIGFRGQSNYSAANMFMTGLAAQRRQKGLAASVLAIGLMTEMGYVAQAGRGFEEYIRKQYKSVAVLEPDFHQMFAEAVLAGRPDSLHQSEIIVGYEPMLREFPPGDRPSWFFDNPRFCHSTLVDTSPGQQIESAEAVPIAQRITGSNTKEEAAQILQRGLVHRLATVLQTTESSIDENAPLTSLGVDSLVAIEIRSWFIRELDVYFPALKIVSGCSAADLCDEVIRKLLPGDSEKVEGISSEGLPIVTISAGTPTSNSEDESLSSEKLENSGVWTIVNPSRAQTPAPVGSGDQSHV